MQSYEALSQNIAAVEKVAAWIFGSQMFGVSNIGQASVIAAHLFITGEPLLDYQRRNQLVSGKPSDSYDVMIANFQKEGGKLRLIQKTPDIAKVELEFDGNKQEFSLTWEELQKEPIPYNGKEADIIAMLAKGEKPALKAKYATPRSRGIMLYARCVSDAIRTIAAKVNFGTYTPEEIEDFTDTNPSAAGDAKPVNVLAPHLTASTPAADQSKPVTPPAATQQAVATAEPAKVESVDTGSGTTAKIDGPATEQQKKAILEQMAYLHSQGDTTIKDRVVAKLKESGIQGILGLSLQEADILYDALKKNELKLFFDLQLQGHPKN